MTEQQAIWSVNETTSIKSYTLVNFRTIPQIQQMSEEAQFEMEVVGNVLPFKTNNYVVEQLIDWSNIPKDPMFVLTFPQKGMLIPEHYEKMASVLRRGADKKEIQNTANEIRLQLNPHPAGQMELNVPQLKMGQNFLECNINIKKLVSSFQAKVKHVMLTVVFVFGGPSLLAWMR